MVRHSKKHNLYTKIISNHLVDISNFFMSNFVNCQSISNKLNRLKANCPYCDYGENRQKLTINLDWGNFKCFKCEESGSLNKLLKYMHLDIEFVELLNSLTNLSLYDIRTILKSNSIIHKSESEIENENAIKVKKFIESNGLFNIKKLKSAYNYALKRTYGNFNEVESYLADDKYIYIPISTNDDIIAYMGRRYIDLDTISRYKMNVLEPDKPMISFLDDVTSNFSTNSIYICEGYFDSYAINYVFANYVSICTFGKTNINNTITELVKSFPTNTQIFLTFDSPKKDKEIYSSIISFGKKLIENFPNVFVIELDEGDPADLLAKYGALELKRILLKNRIPYLKYAILNSTKRRIKQYA